MVRIPTFLVILIALVVVGALASAGFFYYRYQQVKQMTAESEVRNLKAMVSKAIELPEEDPTVATVTDPSKLANQAFFKKAQTGDKVLIFTQSKKAILYRPSTQKIIDVVSIQALPSVTVSPTPSPAVFSPTTPSPVPESGL